MTGIIISIALLILANNLVFKIEVKTANKNIQKIVLKELEDLGIKRLTLKKSHKKIEKIVKKILEDNKDTSY